MASAREYFKNKQNELYSQEYRTSLKRHRKHMLFGVVGTIAVIILACIVIYIYNVNRVYTAYDVVKKMESEGNEGSHYIRMNEYLIRYSMDGISCYDDDYQIVWNQSYEMKDPMIDVCGSYLAVCDTGGTTIYILGEEGLKGEVDTQLPIKRIEVASQGVVAALLEEGDINRINYYDRLGTLLAENKAPIEKSGYPMDISLSSDGMKMAVSYMSLEMGRVNTKVAFYNFDSVGENEIDHLVSAQEYEGSVVPEIEFVNATTAIVLGDGFFDVFQGSQKPEEKCKVTFDQEIRSVCHGEGYVGFVLENTGKYPYVFKVYDLSGKECLSMDMDTTYENIVIKKDKVYFLNGAQCKIYSINGKLKFDGDFKGDLNQVLPVDENHLILVRDDEVQTVKLH